MEKHVVPVLNGKGKSGTHGSYANRNKDCSTGKCAFDLNLGHVFFIFHFSGDMVFLATWSSQPLVETRNSIATFSHRIDISVSATQRQRSGNVAATATAAAIPVAVANGRISEVQVTARRQATSVKAYQATWHTQSPSITPPPPPLFCPP